MKNQKKKNHEGTGFTLKNEVMTCKMEHIHTWTDPNETRIQFWTHPKWNISKMEQIQNGTHPACQTVTVSKLWRSKNVLSHPPQKKL